MSQGVKMIRRTITLAVAAALMAPVGGSWAQAPRNPGDPPLTEAAFKTEAKALRKELTNIKNRVFAAKTRLSELGDVAGLPGLTQSGVEIIQVNELGSGFRVRSVEYSLNSAPIFAKDDIGGDLNGDKPVPVIAAPLPPGRHVMNILMVVQAKSLFSYAEDYQFKVRTNYTFLVEPDKAVKLTAVLYDRGSLTYATEERPAIRMGYEARNLEGSGAMMASMSRVAVKDQGPPPNLEIVHQNNVGGQLGVYGIEYRLGTRVLYTRSDTDGDLGREKQMVVFRGYLPPGPQQLTVVVTVKGKSSVFTYVEGYEFRARGTYNLQVPGSGGLRVFVESFTRGRVTRELKDRMAFRFASVPASLGGEVKAAVPVPPAMPAGPAAEQGAEVEPAAEGEGAVEPEAKP